MKRRVYVNAAVIENVGIILYAAVVECAAKRYL